MLEPQVLSAQPESAASPFARLAPAASFTHPSLPASAPAASLLSAIFAPSATAAPSLSAPVLLHSGSDATSAAVIAACATPMTRYPPCQLSGPARAQPMATGPTLVPMPQQQCSQLMCRGP